MWLDELQLTDFRGFRDLRLDLRRQLTVVIGVNGAGKSSLVEAIEIGASHIVQAVFRRHRAIELTQRDVRLGQETCQVGLVFERMHVRVRRSASGDTEREPQTLAEEPLPPLCLFFKSNRATLKADPTCQFIVTTHSPQVIGSVPRESIVVLDDFAVYEAAAPTKGRDSNAILEEIMDVSERSEESRDLLEEIARLIDHEELDRARTAIDQLAGQWGEDDREVVRLRTALQFRGLYDADDSQGQ